MPADNCQNTLSETRFLPPSPPAYTSLVVPRQPRSLVNPSLDERNNEANAASSSTERSCPVVPDPHLSTDKLNGTTSNPDEMLYLCLMEEFDDVWSKVHRKAVEFHIASKKLEHCGHLLSDCRERCLDSGRHDLATNIEPLLEFVNVRAPRLVV